MKISPRSLFIQVFLLFIVFQSSKTDFLWDYCAETSNELNLFESKATVSLNFNYDDIELEEKIGEGADGEVFSINILVKNLSEDTKKYFQPYIKEDQDTFSLVVKKGSIDFNSLNEILVHQKLTRKGVGAAFFGCQYSPNKKNVYIFQQKLDTKLFDMKFLEEFLKSPPSQRLKHYRELFEQVIALYDLGFVNNDIKPDNIMWDNINKRLVIIDFGTVQEFKTPINMWGTLPYMSPSKFQIPAIRKSIKVDLKDDLYSLAITIGLIESQNNPDLIWKKKTGKETLSCEVSRSRSCIEAIQLNVDNALMYLDSEVQTFFFQYNDLTIIAHDGAGKTNFKGLLWAILEYDIYQFDTKEILKIMDQDIARMELAEKKTKSAKPQNLVTDNQILQNKITSFKNAKPDTQLYGIIPKNKGASKQVPLKFKAI